MSPVTTSAFPVPYLNGVEEDGVRDLSVHNWDEFDLASVSTLARPGAWKRQALAM